MADRIKKLWSIVITMTMVLGLMTPVMAVENKHLIEQSEGYDTTIENINNEDAFADAFRGACTYANVKGETSDVTASYTYALYMNSAETAMYYVESEISFSVGNRVYTILLNGNLERIDLRDDLTYLAGPLYGNVTLDNITYEVIVGFNKILQRSGASFCVIMTPENGEMESALSFSFGEDIITDEILTLLLSQDNTLEELDHNVSNAMDLNNGIEVAATNGISTYSASANISGTSIKGAEENFTINTNRFRIAVSTYSYTNNAKSVVAYAYNSMVSKVTIGAGRKSGSVAFTTYNAEDDRKMTAPAPSALETREIVSDGLTVISNEFPGLPGFAANVISLFLEKIEANIDQQFVDIITGDRVTTNFVFKLGSGMSCDTTPCAFSANIAGAGPATFLVSTTVEYAVLGDAGYSFLKAQASKTVTASF